MKGIKISVTILSLMLILATGLVIWQVAPKQQEHKPIPKQLNAVVPEEQQESNKITEPKNKAAVSVLSTAKEGWGFVRNKTHQRPRIAQHQENLLKKYPVIYTMNGQEKNIVLTFDLGYENGYTARILDTLKAHHTPAIFFVTGSWLRENPDLCKRMIAEGHIVGNHTMHHPSLPEIDKQEFVKEISTLEQRIKETTGVSQHAKYLRPPKGEYSEQTLKWTQELGYTTVFWSIALLDWKPLPNAKVVVDGVINNLHPGAVVLLHGVSKEVTEGLDDLLNQIAKEGYKVVRIDKAKT